MRVTLTSPDVLSSLLCRASQPLLRPSSRVLHLGCGNSPLPEALYDAGFKARPACGPDPTGLALTLWPPRHRRM
jgi:hypothetical protein